MSFPVDIAEVLQLRITRIITEHIGLHEPLAHTISSAIITELVRELSGERVYFPKQTRRVSKRERVIAEYNGRNRDELCRRYSISRRTFYRWVPPT